MFVIVTGGDPPVPGVVARLPKGARVIAADSGLDHAQTLGLPVELVVGDLDSVSAAGLARAEQAGVTVERHPVDKDAVDLELGIDAAVALGATHIVVVAGGGDRLDHLMAGLLLLGHPRLAAVRVEAWYGSAHLVALQGPSETALEGPEGTYVTLLPIGGDARGVTTTGLRFTLAGDALGAGTTRGVSNELVGGPASVRIEAGCLLVITPYALGGGA
ncbi:MAG TPA: thiamine diphosphokinase [Acidimicrobiales bacterium]